MANVSDSTFMKVFQEAPGDLGPLTDYKTVSDAIIKAIGQLSENIKLSHACWKLRKVPFQLSFTTTYFKPLILELEHMQLYYT